MIAQSMGSFSLEAKEFIPKEQKEMTEIEKVEKLAITVRILKVSFIIARLTIFLP